MLALEEEIPEITEIDELQTFIGNKKNKVWIGAVVNHWNLGILLWTIGVASHSRTRDRSSLSFPIIWSIIRCWHRALLCNQWMESLSRIY